MIPVIVGGLTGDACRFPVVIDVVPDVPFMSAGNSALGSIDEALATEILTDVKFQDLGRFDRAGKEPRIVDEVLGVEYQCLIGVRQFQLGGRAHEWNAPEYIRIKFGPANRKLGGPASLVH